MNNSSHAKPAQNIQPSIELAKLAWLATQGLFLSVLIISLANAQDEKNLDQELPIPSSKFIPPPPPKDVPPMEVEASSVLKARTHQITVIRSDASTLPDIPPPPEPKPSAPGREVEPSYLLSFGATVYDHQLSHVKWYDPRTKESFEAWCAWDWTLLSPIPEFELGERVGSFHLFASNIDTSKGLRFGKDFKMPEHPALEENAFAITRGSGDEKEAIRILTTIRDYYMKHRDRLVLIQQARQKYQQEADAWHAANPPKHESHTFWLKPHRGSRYLKNEGGTR